MQSKEINLSHYKQEAFQEFDRILQYWLDHTLDQENGGFFGQINTSNQVFPQASKGLVLNARILWSFSAAYQLKAEKKYLLTAQRAYEYLSDFFKDKELGGYYWEVDYLGNPLNLRKQIYGQAFVVYALSEYYKITQNDEVLKQAIDLFELLEKHGLDTQYGGYWEALSREWQPIEDVRLSEKDANEKKSMNTHLHVLEAYTNLYRVWPDAHLKAPMEALLAIYQHHLIDPQGYSQYLFLDENWEVKSQVISFGHDIEASWLIWEAAEVLGKESLLTSMKPWVLGLADTAVQGLAEDGGMNYEFDRCDNQLDTDKHSWVQAEAAVGFLNAYQITGRQEYLDYSWNSWRFLQKYIVDHRQGEWFWGVTENYEPMNDTKVGFWKCPYHSTRACLEIMKRLTAIISP